MIEEAFYPVTEKELDMIHNQNHLWSQRTTATVLSRPTVETAVRNERERVLKSLEKEISIREDEMNHKAGLEDNIVTVSGYYASAGALNWVREVLIKSLMEIVIHKGDDSK
jgi:hypothetical protein